MGNKQIMDTKIYGKYFYFYFKLCYKVNQLQSTLINLSHETKECTLHFTSHFRYSVRVQIKHFYSIKCFYFKSL